MRHSNVLAVMVAALLAPGVGAQTTNNNATNANSNASSGSASNSASYGNVGNSTTNYIAPTAGSNANSNSSSSTSSTSNASNAGNSQTVIFNAPAPAAPPPSATQRQIVSGGTHSSLTTNGTQTVNQNVTGTTNQNVRSESHISGSQTIRYEYGDQTIKNTPSVGGPPLTTSNDTCMGSSSGSVNVPGFGVGLGSTWTDRNCVMLKNARELWNMGMKAAALALFCTDDSNRMALEITGFVCPQTALARQQAAAAAEAARVTAAAAEAERQERRGARVARTEVLAPPPLPLELMPPLQAASQLGAAQRAPVAVAGPAAPAPEVAVAVPQPVPVPQPPPERVAVPEPVAVPERVTAPEPVAVPERVAAPEPVPQADVQAASDATLVRVVSEPAR